MSLKINLNWKKVLKWTFIAIFGIALLVFFVKVATFESSYYHEKEGSERVEAVAVEEEEPLEETVPTEKDKEEYNVAADLPRYLSIPKLNVVKSRVIAVGVKSNGELGTPNNIFDVGWYNASGKPGQGRTIVIDGHNGGPHVHGVFKDLPELVEGDVIKIERGDGEVFNYKVVENKTVPLSEADSYMKIAFRSPEPDKESVTLISCTGDWSDQQRTYLSRQFTRAVLF